MQKWSRKRLVVSFIVLFPLFCCIFPRVGDTQEPEKSLSPIVLGAIFSRTGIAAQHNLPLIEMISATVDWVNSQGGVLGRELQVKLYDNRSTQIGSMVAAREAVRDGVHAVIGAHWSSHSLAMAPVLEEAQVPMITPASSHPDITRDRAFVFRATFIDTVQGAVMARFARHGLGASSTAIMRNIDEQYCNNLADNYRLAFLQYGGTVATDYRYRGNATEFLDIAKELAIAQPDVVYIPGYTRDTTLIMTQLRQQGVKSIFLGGDGWDNLEKLIPDIVEGAYQTAPWHPDLKKTQSRKVLALFEEYYEKKIDNMTTPLAYDAVMALVTAIQQAGSTDPKRIRDALASLHSLEGATGTLTFDVSGDPINKDVILIRYQGGQRKFERIIKPDEELFAE